MHLDNLKGVCASVVNNHSHDFNFAKNRQRHNPTCTHQSHFAQ